MTTWAKGEPWRVVKSLETLNAQIRGDYSNALPPHTDVNAWGSIADDAHSTSSDHYPHYYQALGSVAVVCARDFPHAPALGMDAGLITEALRQSRDSRIGYVIFNRRITGPNHGWQWEQYPGDDPHDSHFHVSSVHTALADNQRDWILPKTEVRTMTGGEYSPDTATAIAIGATSAGWVKGHDPGWDDSLDLYNLRRLILGSTTDAPVDEINNYSLKSIVALLRALNANIVTGIDPVTLKAAILEVLQSPDGQAALTRAANTAEDS